MASCPSCATPSLCTMRLRCRYPDGLCRARVPPPPPFQLHNFLCEMLCTTALVYGALMIYERRDQLYGPERTLFRSMGELGSACIVFLECGNYAAHAARLL